MGGRIGRFLHMALMLWLLQAAPAIASDPLPDDARPVMDHAGLLSAPAAARLASRLEALQVGAGQAVNVLTIETTGGVPIDAYVDRLRGYWEIDRGGHPGALLVIAWRERAIGLVETGQERTLDPERLGTIVRDVITPAFRRNAFDRGIEAGIDAVIAEFESSARRAAVAEASRSEPSAAGLRRQRSGADNLPMLMATLGCALLAGLLGIRARPGRTGATSPAGARSRLDAREA